MQKLFNENVCSDVPQLRFPEYTENWVQVQIKNVAKVIGGGTPKTDVNEYWNGNIRWFTPSEVGKSKYIEDSEKHITEKGLKNSSAKLLPKNSILLSSRATIGQMSISLYESSTNQGFQSLVSTKNICNEFLYYLLFLYKKEFIKKASGSTFLEISKNEIEKTKIKIPSFNEQEKIADFLSVVDKKIELMEKKYNILNKYKKGVMQKLFNENVCSEELIPNLRFNEFHKNWFKYKIKEIGTVKTGKTPSTANKSYFNNGNIIWVTPGDISNKKFVNESSRYLTEEGLKKSIKLPKNAILVTCIGTIGKICMINKKGSCNQQINAIIPNEKYNPHFIYYVIEKNSPKFKLYAGNTATPIINKKFFENLSFYFPSINEQNKIGKFLSLIDKKIELMESNMIKAVDGVLI